MISASKTFKPKKYQEFKAQSDKKSYKFALEFLWILTLIPKLTFSWKNNKNQLNNHILLKFYINQFCKQCLRQSKYQIKKILKNEVANFCKITAEIIWPEI